MPEREQPRAKPPAMRGNHLGSLSYFGGGVALHDEIDQTPILGFSRVHEKVSFHRPLDVFERPARVLGVDASHRLALPKDLLRVELDVGCLALDALREGLMNEDLGVGQRHAHSLIAARQKY